jgi:uncharacterized membrane protein YcfT
VLVVLYHSVLYLRQQDLADAHWGPAMEILRSMRMPLFFAAAGLFAGKWAVAKWRDVLHAKVALFAWVFVVWVVIRWIWYNLDRFQTVEDGIGTLFLRLVWPTGGWFIYTLAIFFLLLKLTNRAPAWLQLAAAGIVSVFALSGVIGVGNHAWDGVLEYYFFFILGVHGRAVLIPLVDRIPLWAALVGAPVAFVVIAGLMYLDIHKLFGGAFVVRIIGLGAGLLLARMLSSWRLLRHLGQNTLPIYMLHSLLIASICTLLAAGPTLPGPVQLVTPILVAAVALTISYYVGVWAAKTPATSWLFDLPAPIARRPATRRSSQASPSRE